MYDSFSGQSSTSRLNSYDFMGKNAGAGFTGLEDMGNHAEGDNFLVFLISMDGDHPVDYQKEPFDSFSDAKAFVNAMKSQSDATGHRFEGILVPGSQAKATEERISQQITGMASSARQTSPQEDVDQIGTYWAEHSEVLFSSIREIYANVRAPESDHIVSYLMGRMKVPENLARAAVYAFNEIAKEALPLHEGISVRKLIQIFQKHGGVELTRDQAGTLTNDQGKPLDFSQAFRTVKVISPTMATDPRFRALLKSLAAPSQGAGLDDHPNWSKPVSQWRNALG